MPLWQGVIPTPHDFLQARAATARFKRTCLALAFRLWRTRVAESSRWVESFQEQHSRALRRCWTAWRSKSKDRDGVREGASWSADARWDARARACSQQMLELRCRELGALRLQEVFRAWSGHLCALSRDLRKEDALRARRLGALRQREKELEEQETRTERQNRRNEDAVKRRLWASLVGTRDQLALRCSWNAWHGATAGLAAAFRRAGRRRERRPLLLQVVVAWAGWATLQWRRRQLDLCLRASAWDAQRSAARLGARRLRLALVATCRWAFGAWRRFLRQSRGLEALVAEVSAALGAAKVGVRADGPFRAADGHSNVGDLLEAAVEVVEERVRRFWAPVLQGALLLWRTLACAAVLRRARGARRLQLRSSGEAARRRSAQRCVERWVAELSSALLEVSLWAWKLQAEARQGGFPLQTPAAPYFEACLESGEVQGDEPAVFRSLGALQSKGLASDDRWAVGGKSERLSRDQ
ncbi:unnamed protein product, partial [Effrenium voratum]